MEVDRQVSRAFEETVPPIPKRDVMSNLGSRVYGLGAAALGAVGLVWGDFATNWAVLYFIFAMLWLPRVVGFPQLFGTWGGMLEEMAPAAAAVVAYASLLPAGSAAATRADRIGRLWFGVCAVSFGLTHFTAVPQTAAMVPRWIPLGQTFWAVATGVAHLLAGVAILTGILAPLASRLLTAMLVGFGALVWAPALFAHPRVHTTWAGNAVNLTLIGAAWVIADSIAGRKKSARGRSELRGISRVTPSPL
ncbi:MAG: DoxX family membrane protein [Acidobacteria bacterium]|nr:DoxX family membrane protein [Acidobacteriota bacterium]